MNAKERAELNRLADERNCLKGAARALRRHGWAETDARRLEILADDLGRRFDDLIGKGKGRGAA